MLAYDFRTILFPDGEKSDKSDKQNNGNAYGKNKGDMSGKEFGQNRAAEAKSKEKVKDEAEENLSEAEEKVKEGKEKVKVAKEKAKAKK